jgi:hypothetical protein
MMLQASSFTSPQKLGKPSPSFRLQTPPYSKWLGLQDVMPSVTCRSSRQGFSPVPPQVVG